MAEDKLFCYCGICNKEGRKRQDIERHIESVHVITPPYVCDLCGTRMAQFFNLSDHRLKVHGEKFISFQAYKDLVAKGDHKFTKECPKYSSQSTQN